MVSYIPVTYASNLEVVGNLSGIVVEIKTVISFTVLDV